MKIISVHTPKAAGTSMLRGLSDALGPGFVTDYGEDPANPTSVRNIDPESYFSRQRQLPDDIRCIHGHFNPGQFDTTGCYLFTLLRHPVDNIISIYFFWKKLPSEGQPLHDYFLAQELDIISMARLPLLRYLYSHTYFGSFDMSRFDFVGRHEERASALARFSSDTGIPISPETHENRTSETTDRDELMADHRLIQSLHEILSDDIRFYEMHAA